ncbi:MAG: winged helix-turn-helix domain-containing protein [Nitrososphaerales archaeon]
MSHKRSKLETYAAILDAVSSWSQRPTNIIFHSNLSWSPLNESLAILVQQGFLAESNYGKRKIFSLTKKGEDALEMLHQIEKEFALEVMPVENIGTGANPNLVEH